MYYVDMSGDAGKAFNMQTDESGLIGVTHSRLVDHLSYQTVAAGGWLFIPEKTDGIASVTIDTSTVTPGVHA